MNTAPGCRIFQSTLPRGERRASAARTPKRKTISIHAPARGATKDLLRKVNLPEISIHAPARGATHAIRTRCFRFGYFNPRSREGSDVLGMSIYHCSIKFQSTLPRGERLKLLTEYKSTSLISIHAPARGATELSFLVLPPISISIHAPARGATLHHLLVFFGRCQFQSTLPRGERRGVFVPLALHQLISIHAPARGATGNGKDGFIVPLAFQSTLPRGERPGAE